MSMNTLVQKIHATAKDKGWWDEKRPVAEIIALCHSELSEALEAERERLPPACLFDKETKTFLPDPEVERIKKNGMKPEEIARYKPEGVAVEMADCVIRIMDYFGYMGWDLDAVVKMKVAYNQTRPHRHGNKAF